MNLLNPKVAVFILAFIPQFVDPGRGSTILQFIIFGTILNVGGTIIAALAGIFSGSIGQAFATNDKFARFFQWFGCIIFLGPAAKLAFERN